MAEIHVERKPGGGRTALLMVLVLVLLGLAAWMLLRRPAAEVPAPAPADTTLMVDTTMAPPPAPVDTTAVAAPVDSIAAPAPLEPSIVGDDTSGRVPPDTARD